MNNDLSWEEFYGVLNPRNQPPCCEWHKAGGDREYPCGGEVLNGIPVYEQRDLFLED